MSVASRLWAVIPAAGTGSRFASTRPKQYLELEGRPVIAHSLQCLLDNSPVENIVVALAAGDAHFNSLVENADNSRVSTVPGGASRARSVLNGLLALANRASDNDLVMVHDAARPLLHPADLANLLRVAGDHAVGAILATPVVDTLKRSRVVNAKDVDQAKKIVTPEIETTVPREQIWAGQTPQLFRYRILLDALQEALQRDESRVTDEASAVEMAGLHPLLVRSRYLNSKITHPADLALAELVMRSRRELAERGEEAVL